MHVRIDVEQILSFQPSMDNHAIAEATFVDPSLQLGKCSTVSANVEHDFNWRRRAQLLRHIDQVKQSFVHFCSSDIRDPEAAASIRQRKTKAIAQKLAAILIESNRMLCDRPDLPFAFRRDADCSDRNMAKEH